MALTYDLTAVKDRDTSEQGWLSTRAVIFHSITVKMWELTDVNASEWYARIHFSEYDLGHTLLTQNGGKDKWYLQPEEIHANVGVKTNEGHDLGRREWIRQAVAQQNAYVDTFKTGKKYTYAEVRELLAKYADEYLEAIEK